MGLLGLIYDTMKAKLWEALIVGVIAYLLVAYAVPFGTQNFPYNVPLIGQSGALAIRLAPSQAMSAGVAAFFASILHDVVIGPLGLGNILASVSDSVGGAVGNVLI